MNTPESYMTLKEAILGAIADELLQYRGYRLEVYHVDGDLTVDEFEFGDTLTPDQVDEDYVNRVAELSGYTPGDAAAPVWNIFCAVPLEMALRFDARLKRDKAREQKRLEKPLFIALKTEFFEAFANGTKTAEYRVYGPRWNEKHCFPGRPVVLSKGYGKGRRLSGVVTGFRKIDAAGLPGWKACYGDNPGPCAAIDIRLV
jgi:hypothetical protein